MNASRNSTHFLLVWTLIGLIVGGVILAFWPSATQKIDQFTSAPDPELVSYADAVARASSAVVSIQTTHKDSENTPDAKRLRPEHGSGVIFEPGHILTNYHVVDNADDIIVTLTDGHQLQGKILGTDPATDLAVLIIEHDQHPPLVKADMNRTRVGDVVLAIGNPFGIGQTVTQGIISATGRDRVGLNTYENFIQTDAAINPGNSGGALINARGEIVGINSAVFSQTGGFQGIGFAIPFDMALQVAQQIIEHGVVIRGWLGVEGMDLNPLWLERAGMADVHGVLITNVYKDGPADAAGLLPRDIITRINQTNIRDTRDVLDLIAQGKPGEIIEIHGLRAQQSFVIKATLAQRPLESK
jgi:serine peptidase DegS